MKRKIVYFIIFGCIGVTTEVFFTAIWQNVGSLISSNKLLLSLKGESYIWIFFIYGVMSSRYV